MASLVAIGTLAQPTKRIRALHPVALAAFAFLAALATLAWRSIQGNGRWVYTLDDPYIHMAMAKNLVAHGVFGVTRFSFSSATSSPLWTLFLAGSYRLLGVQDWIPGVGAALFALAAIFATDSLCRFLGLRWAGRLMACLSVVYLTPLVPLVSTGMEHALHVFLAMVFLERALRFKCAPEPGTLLPMCLAGSLAVAARYESLFLVAPFVFWFLCAKRWRGAVLLLAAAVLPVVAYGTVSMFYGSYFLPNSLMLKGHFPGLDGMPALVQALGGRGFSVLMGTDHLYVICVVLMLGAVLHCRKGANGDFHILALCIAAAIALHLQFASVGWFFRYEAYLVAVSLPVIGGLYSGLAGGSFKGVFRARGSGYVLALLAGFVLLAWPLHQRAKKALAAVVPASSHIYRQQYHMADFTRKMYPPAVPLALNDLGAVSYYSDADILDLYGLGTIEVARAKREGQYDANAIARLLETRQVRFAMLYADWFKGILPESLIPVADWTVIPSYFSKTVTFYATTRAGAKDLENRLRKYEELLPDSVEVTYQRAGSGAGAAAQRAPSPEP